METIIWLFMRLVGAGTLYYTISALKKKAICNVGATDYVILFLMSIIINLISLKFFYIFNISILSIIVLASLLFKDIQLVTDKSKVSMSKYLFVTFLSFNEVMLYLLLVVLMSPLKPLPEKENVV